MQLCQKNTDILTGGRGQWPAQTKPFPQSNSSVYAFYNDAPPVLDYIHGYGHTKGTAWHRHMSSRTNSKIAISIRKFTSGQMCTESTPLLSVFACKTHPPPAVTQCPPLPIILRERLRLPFVWQTQLWSVAAYRWVTSYQPTRLDLFR